MQPQPAIFEEHEIRRVYDEATETWLFSVIDIVRVLTQTPDYQTARKYWKVLKGRLDKEGSQLVTNCHQLKMTATDGKQRPTDVATAETLLRLVQSVPSPKAEPIKLWLAKVASNSQVVSKHSSFSALFQIGNSEAINLLYCQSAPCPNPTPVSVGMDDS